MIADFGDVAFLRFLIVTELLCILRNHEIKNQK
jgi:hypothetical protein